MFTKESLYINVIKYNNQLKLEYKKLRNDEVIKSDNSTFLVDNDILPQNIVQKINTLQKEDDFSYISTLLLSDTTKLIPKSLSSKIKDCEIVEFNKDYDIVVLKTTLFETQNYFGKTGIDYIYSAFHIMNQHIERNKSKNELLFFIYNNKAFVLIVDKLGNIVYNETIDLLTFDSVKRTHFYEDDLEGQKLFDELYFLELTQTIQKILDDLYSKRKDEVFVQKVSILHVLKILTKEQLSQLSQELLLKVDDYSVNVDEEIFKLAKQKDSKNSFIKHRKKKKRKDPRYIFLIILLTLLSLGFYKIYSTIDFNPILEKFNIKIGHQKVLESLPNHVILNDKIKKRVKAIFDSVPNNVAVKEVNIDENNLELKVFSIQEENLNLLNLALNSLYVNNESKIITPNAKTNFDAVVVSKNEIEINTEYDNSTKDYLIDEQFNIESVTEQLKILMPETAIVKYIETIDAKKVEVFSYKVAILITEPNEFFELINKLNEELYSINLKYPISFKRTDNGIEVEFNLEFNQLK